MISYDKFKIMIKRHFFNLRNRLGNETENQPSGKSLQVYWYLLTHEPKGIREIQKALNYPSRSSIHFQVNKLLEKGIASKTENDKYFIKEEIKTGILSFYLRFGYRMIPRFSIYMLIFLVGLIGFLLLVLIGGDQFILNPINLGFLFYLMLGTSVFIYESIRIWRMKPN